MITCMGYSKRTSTGHEILPPEQIHTPAWHQARAEGIGASDIATILGANPYETPDTLWHRKKHHLTVEQNPSMRWGNAMEPHLADEFSRRKNVTLHDPGTWARHDRPWHRCNPDRFLDGATSGLEIKATGNAQRYEDWAVQPDTPTIYQAQWCMHVTGLDTWWVMIGMFGRDAHIHRLERDAAFLEHAAAAVDMFWSDLSEDSCPAHWWGSDDGPKLDAIKRAHESIAVPGTEIVADNDLTSDIIRLREARGIIRELERDASALAARIREQMRDATIVTDNFGDVLAEMTMTTRTTVSAKTVRDLYPDIMGDVSVTRTSSTLNTPAPRSAAA